MVKIKGALMSNRASHFSPLFGESKNSHGRIDVHTGQEGRVQKKKGSVKSREEVERGETVE